MQGQCSKTIFLMSWYGLEEILLLLFVTLVKWLKDFQFLWWHMDQLKEQSCYEFQRPVFGLNFEPFEAQYISQKNAKENQKQFALTAETILQSTYMDDSMNRMKRMKRMDEEGWRMKTKKNEDEEVKLVQQLK